MSPCYRHVGLQDPTLISGLEVFGEIVPAGHGSAPFGLRTRPMIAPMVAAAPVSMLLFGHRIGGVNIAKALSGAQFFAGASSPGPALHVPRRVAISFWSALRGQ